MLVDDSVTTRNRLRQAFSLDPEIDIVAEASDPFTAREPFRELSPDVLVVDVVMPGMDGLTFLRKVMAYRPTAVVLFTSQAGPDIARAAQSAGALAIVAKPSGLGEDTFTLRAAELLAVIKRIAPARTPQATAALPSIEASAELRERVIAIGASTGGPDAVAKIIMALPRELPPILITVHMPAGFTGAFANRLSQLGKLRVLEATDDLELFPGMAVVAPGDRHLVLRGIPGYWRAGIDESLPLRHHRPSVDILFQSVSMLAGARALGVLLTGMGDDGADGLVRMHGQGSTTIAQDEATSVIFGMPQEAIRRGGASMILPIDDIAAHIQRWAHTSTSRKHSHAPTDL